MENVFMDNTTMNNLRRRSSLSLLNLNTNHTNTMYGYYNSNSLQYPTSSFLNPLNNMSNFPLHPPHLLYSSLPITILSNNNNNNNSPQPPLLPLPLKSSTLPSSTKKISNSSNLLNKSKKKNKKNKRPMKPVLSAPKNELQVTSKPMKAGNEEETEEEFLIMPSVEGTSVNHYSLSPPPSSLPFPRLLLMRLRPAQKGSCVAEAVADSGEADDFCRFLRRL